MEDGGNVAVFLTTCIQAHDLARTFPQRITKAKKTWARMLRLFTPAVELTVPVTELIDEQENPPAFDLLSREPSAPPADIAAMWYGLNLIVADISGKGTAAKEDALWLGATRKSQIKQAGENAAIGWLSEGVRRVTGRAHFSAVRDLAEVIVGVRMEIWSECADVLASVSASRKSHHARSGWRSGRRLSRSYCATRSKRRNGAFAPQKTPEYASKNRNVRVFSRRPRMCAGQRNWE